MTREEAEKTARQVFRLALDATVAPGERRPSSEVQIAVIAEALQKVAGSEDTRAANLAMMLRRFIWQANKRSGDDSMKVLAGKASELLASYGLTGSVVRAAIESKEGR